MEVTTGLSKTEIATKLRIITTQPKGWVKSVNTQTIGEKIVLMSSAVMVVCVVCIFNKIGV